MEAINAQAVDEAVDRSQSFARRRHRPSHANVRSTTQRRGKSSKPLAVSERVAQPWEAIADSWAPPKTSRILARDLIHRLMRRR